MLQDIVKADAGHVGAEKYISEIFESWAVFRPQYMTGSGNNKDCEEWFFDRKFIEIWLFLPEKSFFFFFFGN